MAKFTKLSKINNKIKIPLQGLLIWIFFNLVFLFNSDLSYSYVTAWNIDEDKLQWNNACLIWKWMLNAIGIFQDSSKKVAISVQKSRITSQ